MSERGCFLIFLTVAIFSEDYPGWDVGLLYKTPSKNKFADMFLFSYSEDTEIYVSDSFHDNLYHAEKIMIVIYDGNFKVVDKLVFRGVKHVWNWFQLENVEKSSFWEMGWVKNQSEFTLDPDLNKFRFEIGSQSGSRCELTGFFQVVCDLSANCDHYGRLLAENILNENHCLIFFSKQMRPVEYRNAFWAPKLQILTKRVPNENDFELVFSVEAFAGVDAFKYYFDDQLTNPDTEGCTDAKKLYRHPKIRSKIETSGRIKFRIYNFIYTEVVSKIEFRGTSNFSSWFGHENVQNSTIWDIMNRNFQGNGAFFQPSGVPDDAFLRKFYMNELYNRCPVDRGWMAVVSRTSQKEPPCYWEKWWLHGPEEIKRLKLEHQPPYILYATTAESQLSVSWSVGGKIEILIQTIT